MESTGHAREENRPGVVADRGFNPRKGSSGQEMTVALPTKNPFLHARLAPGSSDYNAMR
jgi:hypothetical protein